MSWFSSVVEGIKAALQRDAYIDPNLGPSLQMYTPGNPVYSPKNYGAFVREAYRKNPTAYNCINKIAGGAAGISWKLYTDKSRKREIESHPLLDLWNKPNPVAAGAGAFIETMFGYWHLAGNSYIWAYRPSPNTPPLALWPLRPDRMKAVAGDSGGIDSYVYGYGTPDVRMYELAEIMHLKFPGYDDDIYGLSPVEVASYYIDQINESMGWNTALMQNAGKPASVFMSKSYLTIEQRNQIRDELRKRYSGKRNAGMPLILEADLTWQNMSLKPNELDWLESRERNTRDIAAVFDVAPELVGDSAGKTYANVAEARQALYIENILPKMDRVRDHINSWLVPMYEDLARSGAYFTYDEDDIEALQALYQEAKNAKEQRARDNWLQGVLTLNETREIVGQEPLDGGDCLRIGAVLVSVDSLSTYADQSLTMPAAPPKQLPEPLNIVTPPNQPQLPQPGKEANKTLHKIMDANGIYQPDDLQKQLAALQAKGITRITWDSGAGSCDICQLNDGATVQLGQAFPSGHILPQVHPNCNCRVLPASPAKLNEQLLDLLAQKIAVHMMENKTYAVNEDTRPAGSNPDNLEDASSGGAGVQLRSMPVQEENSHAEDSLSTPALTYKAFMERYG